MNTRLERFLAAENISQSQFADTIGVARAGVSHIIAGRNKPGFDFIENMARHFPTLNLEWLITGKGKMYKTDRTEETLFHDEISEPIAQAAPSVQTASEAQTQPTQVKQTKSSNPVPIKNLPDIKRVVSKIVVFYSDSTFEEFNKF